MSAEDFLYKAPCFLPVSCAFLVLAKVRILGVLHSSEDVTYLPEGL